MARVELLVVTKGILMLLWCLLKKVPLMTVEKWPEVAPHVTAAPGKCFFLRFSSFSPNERAEYSLPKVWKRVCSAGFQVPGLSRTALKEPSFRYSPCERPEGQTWLRHQVRTNIPV